MILALTNTSYASGLTQAEFDEVIDKLETIYAPIISSHQGKLVMSKRWEFRSANAFAYRTDNKWGMEISGGLARHPQMTKDAFALALCHELGHLLGGAPKFQTPVKKIYTNEGQADYYASLKCLRTYFLNDNNEAIIAKVKAPLVLSKSCKKAHKDKRDQSICIRTGLAALDTGNFLAAVSRTAQLAKIETPDQTVVTKTNDAHPTTQCRIDTLFQGALCDKNVNDLLTDDNELSDACHAANGDKTGLRPACWYKSEK
jgi:hypothetical protein